MVDNRKTDDSTPINKLNFPLIAISNGIDSEIKFTRSRDHKKLKV